jgi:hypothetical protein
VVGMECEEPIPFGCLVVHGGREVCDFIMLDCGTLNGVE